MQSNRLTAASVTRDFRDPAATITLDESARHRRRMMMTTDRTANGSVIDFLLDLPAARLLRHGDGLVLNDGRVIEVRAAPERLMQVTGRDPRHLLTLAWQIGNRHLPAEISGTVITLRRDHVIRAMLEGLGATVSDIDAAFDPEGGAYGGHGGHGHGHGQGGDHRAAEHDHGDAGHRHDHGHSHD
ncbi:urease accessory protein [Hoeflea marina]|uniref:Urease accessory protein UreE n=1 Tax=Hoeflea marina TaxID=274592 RepID=A0A317PLX6_9HYPH|nr:urease accessory protein UreE [Hoeflea marina]PWW01747.1 urease accessory protein [Hoeflea marina]